ncbi:MAG TPA: hypothetical protein VGD99_20220 [Anaerolineae bacterium]|jgi:hypothetical protein
MTVHTIDRGDAIALFHEMMQPSSPFRVLRLVGEPKQGKSHLVTKVFPGLARERYQAQCAVVDLRNRAQSIPDIIHAACGLLGPQSRFPAYHTAHREWINRSKVEVSRTAVILSRMIMRGGEEREDSKQMIRHLTAEFVVDLKKLKDVSLVMVFDQLDNAVEATCYWLMDTLLVQLAALPHVRIVIAGQTVPEASGSYAAACQSYELLSVEEEAAYVNYCRHIGANLTEDNIRVLAQALDYNPGQFAEVMPKFMRGEGGSWLTMRFKSFWQSSRVVRTRPRKRPLWRSRF